MSMLNEIHADTVLITGCTTSGCVRATAMDAFAYKFRVAVVEECVFDRIEISHKVTLFDLSMKYADVVSFEETKQYLRQL
jgi:nicotinamidase-related amidase